MRNSQRLNRNSLLIILFLCIFIRFSISESQKQANAQLIPLPPPSLGPKATNSPLKPSQTENNNNNTSPPLIEFLTTSLIEGKNVLEVKITDKSDIKYAETEYVRNRNVVTQELVRDPNNVYKALIDVHSPSAVIVINAFDINGQKASVVKQLNVASLPNSILGYISNLLFYVGKIVVSIFVPTKH
jgi:hypothetical protein